MTPRTTAKSSPKKGATSSSASLKKTAPKKSISQKTMKKAATKKAQTGISPASKSQKSKIEQKKRPGLNNRRVTLQYANLQNNIEEAEPFAFVWERKTEVVEDAGQRKVQYRWTEEDFEDAHSLRNLMSKDKDADDRRGAFWNTPAGYVDQNEGDDDEDEDFDDDDDEEDEEDEEDDYDDEDEDEDDFEEEEDDR